MNRWPKVGERVIVRRTVKKTYPDDDTHAGRDDRPVSSLTFAKLVEQLEAVAVSRVRLTTRAEGEAPVRHFLLGVRVSLRGPLLRAHLADVSPAGMVAIEPSDRCGACDEIVCTCPTLLDENIGDTCCGNCGPGLCYVDQITGA